MFQTIELIDFFCQRVVDCSEIFRTLLHLDFDFLTQGQGSLDFVDRYPVRDFLLKHCVDR
jgi:hypothetical protein